MHMVAFRPRRFKPSVRPMVVVVLPSPAGVGVMAVTRTSLPMGRSWTRWYNSRESLALFLP